MVNSSIERYLAEILVKAESRMLAIVIEAVYVSVVRIVPTVELCGT